MSNIKKIINNIVVLMFCLFLAACQSKIVQIPNAIQSQYPSHKAVNNLTDFSEALVCMDEKLLAAKVDPVYLSSEKINNLTSTSSFSKGGKEMLINALSKMSTKSKAVVYVRYGTDVASMLDLQGVHPDKDDFRVPDFFITGGVTEYNENRFRGSVGGGKSISIDDGTTTSSGLVSIISGNEEATASISNSLGYGTIAMDMSLAYVKDLQVIPGTVSSNTLAIQKTYSNSVSVDLTIGDIGFTSQVTNTEQLDINTIMRSLIEIGSIEIVGKIHNVPYWECFNNVYDKSGRVMALLAIYNNLKENRLMDEFAIKSLKELGYLDKDYLEKTSNENQENLFISNALVSFQLNNQLMASGTYDFNTFRYLFETLESSDMLEEYKIYLPEIKDSNDPLNNSDYLKDLTLDRY